MKNIQRRTVVLALINGIHGFATFILLPVVVLMTFNRTHGAGNNPDGEIFVPLGWFFLALMLFFIATLCVYCIRYINKTKQSKYLLLVFFAFFLFEALSAIVITNIYYSCNYSNFFGLVIPLKIWAVYICEMKNELRLFLS